MKLGLSLAVNQIRHRSGVIVPGSIEYLIVAGGGGGAHLGTGSQGGGGGGGGGGVVTGTSVLAIGSYSVTIGLGGIGGVFPSTPSTDGQNSLVTGLVTAIGGGGAGTVHSSLGPSYAQGRPGGSGGGSGMGYDNGTGDVSFVPGGAGVLGQGFAGGGPFVLTNNGTGGGGGGAGGVGENGVSGKGGNGGPGVFWNGTPYAGGGGGNSKDQTVASLGGVGGGGNSGSTVLPRQSGAPNTGGGGGAGSVSSANGGDGGSGIVIFRYPTGAFVCTGGTITNSGGFTTHTFASSGTFQRTA
jgi:hypothetical protein